MSDRADVTAALGRLSSATGAIAAAVAAALQEADRRERAAERREREAEAVVADAERRLEHLLAQKTDRSSRDYRAGYLAGRAAKRQGRTTDDVEADVALALSRRRRSRA